MLKPYQFLCGREKETLEKRTVTLSWTWLTCPNWQLTKKPGFSGT